MTILDQANASVLARYPPFVHGPLAPLRPGDSFSGAAIWRIDASSSAFCLKAWPAGDITPQRLGWIHGLMKQARQFGLGYVPDVIPTRAGPRWLAEAGRLWDLSTWMPGQADFQGRPTPARLAAACAALARLHDAWSRLEPSHAPCSAVERRLGLLARWRRLVQGGWRPMFIEDDPASPAAQEAWKLLASKIDLVPNLLAGWRDRPMSLQPCLCDVWHAHILFEGDEISGIIDYGSAKVDHVAGDLARLLGSLAGDDAELRGVGLRAYRTVRPLALEEEALIDVLDRSGTILSAANWLMMLYGPGEGESGRAAFGREHRAEAGRRLAELVKRLARWAR